MRLFQRHLDDADLGLNLLDAPDAAAAAHLASCGRCRRRQEHLATRLTANRAAANAAADQAFSAAVLDAQRQSILARIGRLGAAARVLPFPVTAPAPGKGGLARADRRWVLAAAAAGLILGIAVGRLPGTASRPGQAPAVDAPRVAVAEPVADPRRDDLLLSDVDEVLGRAVRPEFAALDGLTPVVYEAR